MKTLAAATAGAAITATIIAITLTAWQCQSHSSDQTGHYSPNSNAPYLVNAEAKSMMLESINRARESAGVDPVTLGTSNAPQMHAEDMLQNCYTSHWTTNGRKPYIRNALAGGSAAYTAENIQTSAECGFPESDQEELPPMGRAIQGALQALLNSPGHRANILNPDHERVSLGIAWNSHTLKTVQQFEQKQATAVSPLTLSGGTIALGVVFLAPADEGQVFALLAHDPPDQPLTRGQLDNTSCYEGPEPIAAFLKTGVHSRNTVTTETTDAYQRSCPDPRSIPKDAPAARSPEDAARLKEQARRAAETATRRVKRTSYVPTYRWEQTDHSLHFAADITTVIKEYGRGFYTVIIVHSGGQENAVIGEWTVQKK